MKFITRCLVRSHIIMLSHDVFVLTTLPLFLMLVTPTQASISTVLSPSQVNVDSAGKYQDLVVSINLRVETSQENEYLVSVKEQISHLSEDVYRTLGLQFGRVTILVPPHWDSRNYSTTYNQGPETADIIVLPLSSPAYTQHIQGCGAEALHLKIDSDYIRSESGSTSDGRRLILHEWLHARYGVFDEHPLKSIAAALVDQQKFYHSSDSTIEAVRCNRQLHAETSCQVTKNKSYADLNGYNSLPKSWCDFTVSSPADETSSIMSHYTIENVGLPCNASTHNGEAPNQHNRLCRGVSVQEIINQHRDSNHSAPKSGYQAPIFSVKKLPRARTLAFVLDTSNSMNGSRLFTATQAIGSMIENIIEDYASILIVSFDLNPKQLYPIHSGELAELDSPEARQRAVESLIGVRTGDHTCIGCGLELAYNITKNAAGGISKASFILLTDGRDTKKKTIKETMYNRSREESFLIDTILLSEEADENLVALARDSGSAAFSANEDSSALIDAFTEIITNRQNYTSQVVQIYNRAIRTEPGQTQTGSFSLEGHLSKMAELTFYMDNFKVTKLSFWLQRENDGSVLYNAAPKRHGFGYFKVPLDIGGDFKAEESVRFNFRIQNKEEMISHKNVITVNTRSDSAEKEDGDKRRRRDTDDSDALYDQSYAMKAYVDAETNFTISRDSPVPKVSLHAFPPPGSVPSPPEDVIATVTVVSMNQNQSDEFEIRLRDGGVAADVIKGDNIFSAHFTKFVSYNATYSVRVRASGSGSGYMRYASTGYFSVYIEPGLDTSAFIPPATILDLQVMERSPNKVDLSFTNTGADLDSGRAHQYRVMYSLDYHSMRRGDNMNITDLSVRPGMPYESNMIEFLIPNLELNTNDTLWLAIKTLDENGLYSDMSNMVSARYISEINRNVDDKDTSTEPKLDDVWIYLIIALAAVLLFLILVISCIFCYCRRRRRKEAEKHNSSGEVNKFFSPDNTDGGTDTIGRASVFMVNDLAEQDVMTFEPSQRYDTYNPKLVTTKRPRIKSFKFTASLKRQPKQKKEKKAPPPPPRNNNNNNVKGLAGTPQPMSNSTSHPKATPATNGQSGFAQVVSDRGPQTAHVPDLSSFPNDLQTGEEIAQKVIGEKQPVGGDVQL